MGIDPVSLAVIGLAGSAITAGGQYASGQAQSAAAAYQSVVAQNNANIAKQNASMESAAGETAVTNKGLQARATVGKAKAYAGTSGVDPNTGSTKTVQGGVEEMGMLDALTTRSNAAKKAWASEVQATSEEAQSKLYDFESDTAAVGGDIGAAGSLLSGASTVGGNYLRWQNQYGTGGP
jgi:hypothetical protein